MALIYCYIIIYQPAKFDFYTITPQINYCYIANHIQSIFLRTVDFQSIAVIITKGYVRKCIVDRTYTSQYKICYHTNFDKTYCTVCMHAGYSHMCLTHSYIYIYICTCYLLTNMFICVPNVVITVGPTMTAITVQEPDQMAVIQIMNFAASFPSQAVPFTITYVTTDGTATGRLPQSESAWLYSSSD